MLDSPDAAIAAMVARLSPLGEEKVPLASAFGRVLAQAVYTDRPSPACDVSAMDGYAVRLNAPLAEVVPVLGEVPPGQAPPQMPGKGTLRIFTGAPVPAGCEAVIPREHVEEQADAIVLPAELRLSAGQFIRRCGENGSVGELVVESGRAIGPNLAASLASFGVAQVAVQQRVRLAVIVTGNEVGEIGSSLQPWQLRDSNGPALTALFGGLCWIDWQGVEYVGDDQTALQESIARQLPACDALLLTGGVSAGDYDFVPAALATVGCSIAFHKLPIRPGKPLLGALGPTGQAVLGLPGNPVSVLATGRRIVAPIIGHLAGLEHLDCPDDTVTMVNADDKLLPQHWSRPVRLVHPDRAELVPCRGSGDVISAARSDGFVEIPPQMGGPGPWPFFRWSLSR